MLEGFELRQPAPAPGARFLPEGIGKGPLPLALTAWGSAPSHGLAPGY